MKVCHLTSVHALEDIRIFTKQCVSLAEKGFDVTLIACGDQNFTDIKKGVKRISLKVNYQGRLQRIVKCQTPLFNKAMEVDADIYQFHDPELLPLGKRLKTAGKKVIYDSHEDVSKQILYKKWLGPLPVRKVFSKLYNKYEKQTVSGFAGVISVIDEITESFTCKRSITIKNLPILKSFIRFNPEQVIKKKQLVYVGSLSKERGIADCIKALDYLPKEYSLLLVGKFNSEAFEVQCKMLPQWQRVEYVGFQPHDKVVAHLAESEIGLSVLHPEENYLNSLPTKGFEYMAMGLPLVISNFKYWAPYFEGCAIAVKPKSAKAIGEAALSLIQNKKMYNEMANTCLKNRLKYSWEAEADKLKHFYESILQQ